MLGDTCTGRVYLAHSGLLLPLQADNQTKQVCHKSMWLLRSLQLAAGRSNAWKPCIALCRPSSAIFSTAKQATSERILHRLQEDRRS